MLGGCVTAWIADPVSRPEQERARRAEQRVGSPPGEKEGRPSGAHPWVHTSWAPPPRERRGPRLKPPGTPSRRASLQCAERQRQPAAASDQERMQSRPGSLSPLSRRSRSESPMRLGPPKAGLLASQIQSCWAASPSRSPGSGFTPPPQSLHTAPQLRSRHERHQERV